MPETKYTRDTNRFDVVGLDLNRPVDSVKNDHFPYLKNCRSYVAGRLEPRFGLTDINVVVPGQTQVHSCRRLTDIQGTTRVVGAGTHVAYGTTVFTDLDSGYSSNPLALVPWKPQDSPYAFMYIGDSSRMRKVGTTGALHTIGWAAPAAAPGVALGNSPSDKDVDSLQSNTGWAATHTATLAAAPVSRVNTTVAQILFDVGNTGWASINPASMANIGEGCKLTFGGGVAETVVVQATYPGTPVTATTTFDKVIASIIYDSGTTGLASLVLTTPIDQVNCDAIIRNTTVGPENARILAVTKGPDGNMSLRISTTNTWASTNTVQILATFRAYCTSTHAAAETLTRSAVQISVTAGTGELTKTSALDLSLIATGLPSHPDDIMHISMSVSDPTVITEVKVQLDVDIATNDFTQNYYTRSFRSNDLTLSAANLQSLLATRQQILQRNIIDAPVQSAQDLVNQGLGQLDLGGLTPDQFVAQQQQQQQAAQQQIDQLDTAISQQLDAGNSQYVELSFRLGDLTRIGTDMSRTLQNVEKIRMVALVTGNVNINFGDWYIAGGFGPDTSDPTASPYFYRYRVREKSTNVASNFSPATRYQLNPKRQSVAITPTQYAAPSGTSLTTADFVIDIARYGGQIAQWHYVGTVANGASPGFVDVYPDDIVAGQPIQANDNYQPWPVKGIPVSGTTGTVAGTTVNDSGANFNTSWDPGTRILINNQPYTIYDVLSTSRLELVENAGSQSAVSWRIDEPVILAQTLACLWVWDDRFFGCADTTNPGRLYYSNVNSETTQVDNYIDITSPSEPLMNGLSYNIRGYVFSSENLFQILVDGDSYRAEQIPNGKGLYMRWALTRNPAPFICFLGKDGIYMTSGATPVSLTDGDLYPLFPNEGNAGIDVNGVTAPVLAAIQAKRTRMEYYDSYLYFDYVQASGTNATLILDFNVDTDSGVESPRGWWWDLYGQSPLMHYGEEGSGVHSLLVGATSGHLYQYTGTDDAGTPISMEFTTPSRDQSQPRENKRYGDIMIDADTANVTAACTPFMNNNATAGSTTSLTTASRLQTAINIGSVWQVARNISLNVVVPVSTSSRPLFYIWEPRWTFESAPISGLSWEISPTSFGMDNYKSFGICKIAHVSTANLTLTFTVDGVAQTPITITNSGGLYEETILRVPVYKGKLYSIRLASDVEFRLDPRDSFFEIKEWASDNAYSKTKVFGDYAFIEG